MEFVLKEVKDIVISDDSWFIFKWWDIKEVERWKNSTV